MKQNQMMFPPQDGRCAAYLRRSQQEAEYEQYGKFAILERHRKLLLDMAEDYGHTIQRFYKEVVSGETIAARDEFKTLLREIARGEWDIIYVVEASRLGRGSGADQDKIINAFRFSRTWLVTEGKIYNPNLKADMRALRKELQKAYDERDNSIERLYRGRTRASKEGCYMPSRAPYGWQIAWDGRNRTLEPHPVNYERMMSIYDMLDDGQSMNHIAMLFNGLGYETSHGGKRWSSSAIRQIAQNTVNIGKITWEATTTEEGMDDETFEPVKVRVSHDDYIEVDGLHKGHCTLSVEKFERVQRKVEMRLPFSVVAGKGLQNPLAGLLRCAKCGMTLKHYVNKTMAKPTAIYTHQTFSKVARFEPCTCKSVHVDFLMSALVETLSAMQRDREVQLTDEGRDDRRERHMAAIASCERDVESARDEKKRVMQGYRKGVYTDEEFVEEKKAVDGKIESLEQRLAELRETVPDDSKIEREVATIGKCIDIIKSDATPKETNDALKQFISRIEYENFAPRGTQKQDIRLRIFFA